jgi:cobalt-zinc-cadmium efflux system outer membrane protein
MRLFIAMMAIGSMALGGAIRARAQQPPALPATTSDRTSSTRTGAAQGETISLDELVREALDKNPEIQSYSRRVTAMRARVPQAKTLPDPEVSVGWMGRIKPFSVMDGDPSSYRGITAMEMFPYPGKLKLRGKIADREAEATQWEYEAARRRVVSKVKTAYYDYSYAHEAIDITQKNKDLMEKLYKIAEARYQVGKGIQPDVLKAQVELSRLLQQLTILNQREKTAKVRLNTLLNRDPETPLPPPASFQQADLTETLEQLYHLAQQNDTGLQQDQRLIERDHDQIALAKRNYLPDFTVGYMYQQRPDMPDMHGVTVGINIPIFYKSKQREEVRGATESLIGEQKNQENRKTNLFFEVKEQYLAAKSSEELARLYSTAVVPQSSLALESSMSAYEVGKVDFLTILDNFVTVLDYQVGYYRELANYQIALARLEPLVGVELTK